MFGDAEAKGKTEGRAESLIRLLTARLGHVPAKAQQIIQQQAKTDSEALSVWFDEAALATDAEAARKLLRKITAT